MSPKKRFFGDHSRNYGASFKFFVILIYYFVFLIYWQRTFAFLVDHKLESIYKNVHKKNTENRSRIKAVEPLYDIKEIVIYTNENF